jgi:hypothetical protein
MSSSSSSSSSEVKEVKEVIRPAHKRYPPVLSSARLPGENKTSDVLLKL